MFRLQLSEKSRWIRAVICYGEADTYWLSCNSVGLFSEVHLMIQIFRVIVCICVQHNAHY